MRSMFMMMNVFVMIANYISYGEKKSSEGGNKMLEAVWLLLAHHRDDIEAVRAVEAVQIHIMFRGLAHIPPFFLVNSCDGWKIVFIASCLDLHEHQFAVLVGNDVDFVVVAAPVSRQDSVVSRGEEETGLLFALVSSFVIVEHGKLGSEGQISSGEFRHY